jgi:mRNA interferase RelE/StbE
MTRSAVSYWPAVHRVEISAEAAHFFRRVPYKHALQIDARIQRLAAEPFPPGCLKLQGTADVYRVRQGPYRIVYRLRRADGVLVIESIGDRKDIYR